MRQEAQVLVLFAITATSILAIVGLLYSFGLIFSQRRALQTAADASSLSGAWQVLHELESDNRADSSVLATVVQFATANGVPTDGTTADATFISASYLDSSGTPLASVGSGGAFPVAARGVLVTVTNQVPTILPGFLKVWQVLVQDSASAIARSTAPPPSAGPVVPIAVLASSASTSYAAHAAYDLFTNPTSGGQPPTLDLAASGAPSFGSIATNLQYWSDGQHSSSWQMNQPGTVSLARGPYYDSIATGLHDNVRRQALPTDGSGASYALITLPVYDTSTATTVHIVGFIQAKVRNLDISASTTRVMFVPRAAAAWGTPTAPAIDLGATLVGLVP